MEFLTKLILALNSRWCGLILRARGVRLQGKCWLQHVRVPRNPRDICLHEGVMLDELVTLLCTGPQNGSIRIEIGSGSYINRQTFLDASERVSIGPRCLIGPFCYITDHDHDLDGAPGELISRPTQIEAECWLGAHVTVLKGVTIGRGSIIGAGSVVTKSIPPRSVAVGNPARVIRVRSDRIGQIGD